MIILWHSNAPFAPTGYGNQTAIFPRRLRDMLGHGLTISAFYGLNGSPRKADDMWIFPCGRESFGNDTLSEDAAYLRADIVITLMDVWVMNTGVMSSFRWVPWLPIDHDPAPPCVTSVLSAAYQPIAYSKFGVSRLEDAGFKPLYVPHGIETNIFKPMPKSEARSQFTGCPRDAFLVGIVAANKGRPSRKAFDQQIRAFAELHRRHKDTMLYLHTEFEGENNGEQISRLVDLAGIEASAIAKPDQYQYRRGMIGTPQMVNLYNCFDVLMNATRGEGFGIPIIEAQACGTPVIVTDFTAMPELCFSGWKVGVSDVEFTYQGSYQAIPSVTEIVDVLEEAYQTSDEKRAEMREKARAGAMEYDADHVTETYWKPALQAIERRIFEEEKAAVPHDHTHRWAQTGIDVDGQFSVPCLYGKCDVARVGRYIKPGIFPSRVGDMEMDIQDDEHGGISKMVMRLAVDNYHIDQVELSAGDTVLDLGAHVGVISSYLARKFDGVRIIAVEPSKDNVEKLMRNAPTVEVVNIAATRDGRPVQFPLSGNGNSGGMTIYGGGEVALESASLKGLLARVGFDPPALIKIDIEGAEYELLEGCTELLKGVRYLVGEFHTNNVFSPARAEALIEACKKAVEPAGQVWIERTQIADIKPAERSGLHNNVSIITPWMDHPELIDGYENVVRGAEVIIVDNASSAETARKLIAMTKRLGGKYIRNETNNKFARANNQGLEQATGDIVVFLNNDVEGNNNWMAHIELDMEPNTLVGPAQLAVPAGGVLWPYIEGWCIAARREVWDRLGGWDADAFHGMYSEDVDLSLRAHKMGISQRVTDWEIVHLRNVTTNTTPDAKSCAAENAERVAKQIGEYLMEAAVDTVR